MIRRSSVASAILTAAFAGVAACAAAPAPAGPGEPAVGPPARWRSLALSGPPLAGPMPLAACTPSPPAPSPRASEPRFGCGNAIVSGVVYDPAGAPADGATVVLRSQDASVPYMATALTGGGAWVVNNLPSGAQVEVFAVGGDWITARFIIEARCDVRNTIDLHAEPVYPADL